MLVRVHHAQITVARGSEEGARRFYCGVLGTREVPKPDALQARGGSGLQLADNHVHVGIEDGVNRESSKAHVAYEVSDLASWRSTLATHGISIQGGETIPGYDRFEFRDPFGNRVEFLQKVGKS